MCSSAEATDFEFSDHSSLPPLEYEDLSDYSSLPPLEYDNEIAFSPVTSSSKLMFEQQDNSTVEHRKEAFYGGMDESICTEIIISSVDTNNSSLKIPYHSPQEKQHCRPRPSSPKENVLTSYNSPVKELKQGTSNKGNNN